MHHFHLACQQLVSRAIPTTPDSLRTISQDHRILCLTIFATNKQQHSFVFSIHVNSLPHLPQGIASLQGISFQRLMSKHNYHGTQMITIGITAQYCIKSIRLRLILPIFIPIFNQFHNL